MTAPPDGGGSRRGRTAARPEPYTSTMDAEAGELVKALGGRRGEEAAAALYRAHAGEVYGFALRRLGDRQLAEELVQEVFTRVWQHADGYDRSRSSFRTWLYAIARNAAVDFDRRRAARPPGPVDEAPGEAVDEPIERAVLRWQVKVALERLSREHRQVIRLAHFEGLALREISDRTGLPLGTVKSRASYALRNLRLALEEMGVAP